LIAACRVFARATSRLFWRIEFHGIENIPDPSFGGFIIAANHQTYIDPVWISIPVYHDIRYLAWDRAFEWPLLGTMIERLGAMPVRLERGSTYSSLRVSLQILKEGRAVMIFPEGEREFADGEVMKFRTGAVHLAAKSGVPILPVTIKGANKVWPREQKIPRLRKVEIYYHPLMYATKTPADNISKQLLNEKNDLLRQTILSPLIDAD